MTNVDIAEIDNGVIESMLIDEEGLFNKFQFIDLFTGLHLLGLPLVTSFDNINPFYHCKQNKYIYV